RTRTVFLTTSPGRSRPRLRTDGETVTAVCKLAATEIGIDGTPGSLVKRVTWSRNAPGPAVGFRVTVRTNWAPPAEGAERRALRAVTSPDLVWIRVTAKSGRLP